MKDATDNFGVVIAFLIPGFVLLWGLSFSFSELAALISTTGAAEDASIGGFLYATLASMALGLLISGIRWMIIDKILENFTGLTIPDRDFSKLKDSDTREAFHEVNENHYRYYQYYSNTAVAVAFSSAAFLFYGTQRPTVAEVVFVLAMIVALLFASRDCLKKFYERSGQILKRETI